MKRAGLIVSVLVFGLGHAAHADDDRSGFGAPVRPDFGIVAVALEDAKEVVVRMHLYEPLNQLSLGNMYGGMNLGIPRIFMDAPDLKRGQLVLPLTIHVGVLPLLLGKVASLGFGFTLDAADIGPVGTNPANQATSIHGGAGVEAVLPIHLRRFALITTATLESFPNSGGTTLGRRALAFEGMYIIPIGDKWGLGVDVEMRYEDLKFVDGSGRDSSWNWTIGLLALPAQRM